MKQQKQPKQQQLQHHSAVDLSVLLAIANGKESGGRFLRDRPHMITDAFDVILKTQGLEDALDWNKCIIGGGDARAVPATLRTHVSSGVCGKSWGPGEITFKCVTCEKDPTCGICADCFYNGNHEGHDFSMQTASQGICDCGDPESWNPAGFCKHHSGPNPTIDPLEGIPAATISASHAAIVSVVKYLSSVVTLLAQRRAEVLRSPNAASRSELQPLVANATRAIRWLGDIASLGLASKRLVTLVFTTLPDDAPENDKYLDRFVSIDHQLPKSLDSLICGLIFVPLFVDMEFKRYFAQCFVRNYKTMVDSNSYASLLERRSFDSASVQIFTVPSLVIMLCDGPTKLLQTFMDSLELIMQKLDSSSNNNNNNNNSTTQQSDPNAVGYQINFSSPQFHSGVLISVLHDIHYTLMVRDAAYRLLFRDQMVTNRFAKFLAQIQGCWYVRRIDSDDDTWQHSFTLELSLSKVAKDTREGIRLAFELHPHDICAQFSRLLLIFILQLVLWFPTDQDRTLTTKGAPDNPELPPDQQILKFDVEQGPITFHIPLHRFVASFVHEFLRCKEPPHDLNELLSVSVLNQDFFMWLLEHPLRLQVVRAHVRTRLWPRNNMQITQQALNYEGTHFHDYGMLHDYFIIQLCTLFMEPRLFLSICLERFQAKRLQLFALDVCGDIQPAHESYILIEEDFLKFLFVVLTDRTYSGMTVEQIVRRYILHSLFLGKQTHSKLVKSVPSRFRNQLLSDRSIDDIIHAVSDFTPPSSVNDQGIFSVKRSCWKELDPYFVHYNRPEIHDVEDNYHDCFKKEELQSDLLPMLKPADLFESFSGVMNVLHCDIVHKIIFCILYNMLYGSALSSDRLITSMIHLIHLSLETFTEYRQRCPNPVAVSSSDSTVFSAAKSATPGSPISVYALRFPSPDDILVNARTTIAVENFGGRIHREESILSMLLTIHLRSEFAEKKESILALLTLFSDMDEQCEQIISNYEGGGVKTATELAAQRRKEAARQRQKEILSRIASQQQAFIDKFSIEDEDEDQPSSHMDVVEEEPEEHDKDKPQIAVVKSEFQKCRDRGVQTDSLYREVYCAICHASTSPNNCNTIGLLAQIAGSNNLQIVRNQTFDDTLHIRRDIPVEAGGGRKPSDLEWPSFRRFNNSLWLQNIHESNGAHIHFCGHMMHMDCMSSYFSSLIDSSGRGNQFKGEKVIDLEHFEFLCPLCGRLTNSLCPITPNSTEQPDDELSFALGDNDDDDKDTHAPTQETLSLLIDSVDPTKLNNLRPSKEYRFPESSSSDYSFTDALDSFALRFSCVRNDWDTVSFDTDLFSQLCSMLPYNIGIIEVDQRTTFETATTTSPSEIMKIGMISMPQSRMAEMRVLLRALLHYRRWVIHKDARTNQTAHDPMEVDLLEHSHSPLVKHMRLLANVLSNHDFSGLHNKSNEEHTEDDDNDNTNPEGQENVFPPLLSCDLFTLLVYLTILRPDIVLRPRAFRSLLRDLYVAAVFQAFMVWMQWFQARHQDPVAYPGCNAPTWLHKDSSHIVKSVWEFRLMNAWWVMSILKNNEDTKLREAFPSLPSLELVRQAGGKAPSFQPEDADSSASNDLYVRSLFELLATFSSFTAPLNASASVSSSEGASASDVQPEPTVSISPSVDPRRTGGAQDMDTIDDMDEEASNEGMEGRDDADSEGESVAYVKGLCLPFLRRVALFDAIVFCTELPNSSEPLTFSEQFDVLTRHLGLPSLEELMQGESTDVIDRAHQLVKSWTDQFLKAIKEKEENPSALVQGRRLIKQIPLCLFPKYGLPFQFHLIPLPPVYQKLYQQFYHTKCDNCSRQIKYPVLCLVTGKIAWLGSCECNLDGNGKCNQHRREFTGGNGLFIVIAASSVLLMRGTRHTFLMSPYLDQHGEQDWGLRRGKPLFLDRSRVQFLASRFLTNTWDQDTQILANTQTRDTDSY